MGSLPETAMRRKTCKPDAGNAENESKYLSYSALPAWLRENKYILTGYRQEMGDFSKCFQSVFGLHNETVNIWTHLVGFLVFGILTILFYVRPFCELCHRNIEGREKIIFLLFFMGATTCLFMSPPSHTVSCHSQPVNRYFKKLDYTGIVCLIVGSFVPFLYYGFYCQPLIKQLYLVVIIVLGLCTMCVIMMDRFGRPEYKKARALLFVLLGGFGFIPGYHCIALNGWENAVENLHIDGLLVKGLTYIFGAILYGLRIPERFCPGRCDIWFQSHQIFHILVVVAALIHYKTIGSLALYRLTQDGQCSLEDGNKS